MMEPDQVGDLFRRGEDAGAGPFRLFRRARRRRPALLAVLIRAATRRGSRAFVRDTLHWTFWPSLAMVVVAPHRRQAAAPALRPDIRQRLSAPLHPVGRPPLPRLDRTGREPAHHGRPAGDLRRHLHRDLHHQCRAEHHPHPALRAGRGGDRHGERLVVETLALYWATASRLGMRCSILHVLRPVRPIAEIG